MPDTLISVDVETAGPSPGRFSLLAIGACLVEDADRTFYAELQPDRIEVDAGALAVSRLSMEDLAVRGLPPAAAMRFFADWIEAETPQGTRPVCVALNAPFDWMFIAEYFHRYLSRNPFGHTAIDLKALFMGVAGVEWSDTSFAAMAARYNLDSGLPHHTLEDAIIQADLCRRILQERATGPGAG